MNVPLNNALQALDVDGADEATCRETRARFEPRWNGWNRLRTALAMVSTVLLIAVLSRA